MTCPGFVVTIEGTLSEDNGDPVSQTFTVALGPATQEKRHVGVGDLLRGEAHRVPENTPDVPADLYKVGILRTIAPGKRERADSAANRPAPLRRSCPRCAAPRTDRVERRAGRVLPPLSARGSRLRRAAKRPAPARSLGPVEARSPRAWDRATVPTSRRRESKRAEDPACRVRGTGRPSPSTPDAACPASNGRRTRPCAPSSASGSLGSRGCAPRRCS